MEQRYDTYTLSEELIDVIFGGPGNQHIKEVVPEAIILSEGEKTTWLLVDIYERDGHYVQIRVEVPNRYLNQTQPVQ